MPELSGRRDSYIDNLRGGFHVLMLVDHLPFVLPGMFTLVAWLFECVGYVSVAEGFVFLSGYVAGLVYARIWREKDGRTVWKKACLRSFSIYACYIGAIISLLILVRLGGETSIAWGSWSNLMGEPLLHALSRAGSLLVQPTFLEILPMYALFLLFVPLLIHQLEQGRHVLILVLSATIWMAEQFDARSKLVKAAFGEQEVFFGFFSSFAWQVLFVAGLMCGHRTFIKGPWLPKGWKYPLLAYLIVLFFFCLRHELLELQVEERWLQRSSLGPLRLLNFACIAFLVADLRDYLGKVNPWGGLSFLSKHSLQVFAFHLMPVYIASLFIVGETVLSWWAQLFFISFCIVCLFQIAWVSQKVKGYFLKASALKLNGDLR